MKHFGDITKLNGAELPVVDCITGGSPCQDLSVAGKRAGLDGERSGLFMEQIRIVKEMREHERSGGRSAQFIRPRYMVWENVPGALSSNHGKDFQAVLTEIVRIADQYAPDVPLFGIGGGTKQWTKSGCLYGEMGDWSIAWRVHDAQFWGVPQRRKRIALVADFAGLSAPEILFERKGLSRDPEPGEQEREEAAGTVGTGVDEPMPFQTVAIEGNGTRESHRGDGYSVTETMYTLNSTEQHAVAVKTYRKQAHPMNAEMAQGYEETDVSDTLNVFDNSESRTPTLVYENHSQDSRYREFGDVCETVSAKYGTGGNNQPLVVKCIGNGQADISSHITDNVSQTINCMHDQMAVLLGNEDSTTSLVRRLTPLECERLQGYPDGWTNIGEWTDTKGKVHQPTDSPRYKALGNSIAIPFWFYLLRRISAQYERPATLGSLFDGIGGFPLCWERCNGKGTAIWASEIEEFPIAVTKKRFPEGITKKEKTCR